MGKFSAEEIAKRTARLLAVRHLGTAATIRKADERKLKRRAQKQLVQDCASVGVFIPFADFE